MHFKFRKNLRISNELITCLHKLGAQDININLKNSDTKTTFLVWGVIKDIDEKKIEKLINVLNTKRQYEIEEYYWNLPSDYDSDNQLSMVGMMVDSVEVTYENHILTLNISRLN